MAYLQHLHCHSCNTNYQGLDNGTYPHKCGTCIISEDNKKSEKEWKNKREQLPLIDRVRELEQFMYNSIESTKLLSSINPFFKF